MTKGPFSTGSVPITVACDSDVLDGINMEYISIPFDFSKLLAVVESVGCVESLGGDTPVCVESVSKPFRPGVETPPVSAKSEFTSLFVDSRSVGTIVGVTAVEMDAFDTDRDVTVDDGAEGTAQYGFGTVDESLKLKDALFTEAEIYSVILINNALQCHNTPQPYTTNHSH